MRVAVQAIGWTGSEAGCALTVGRRSPELLASPVGRSRFLSMRGLRNILPKLLRLPVDERGQSSIENGELVEGRREDEFAPGGPPRRNAGVPSRSSARCSAGTGAPERAR